MLNQAQSGVRVQATEGKDLLLHSGIQFEGYSTEANVNDLVLYLY